MMRHPRLLVLTFALFALAILIWQVVAPSQHTETLAVPIVDSDGERMGIITVQPVPDNRILINVNVRGLTPGYHGFHIHETGLCEVSETGAFLSAGGHFDMGNHDHGAHAGDLPPLLADGNGRAYISTHTQRFRMQDLFDEDGSAFIIHAGLDNFANIPARYGNADETTRANGDAGARVLCGVIAAPR